jgi:hypothetical protein
MKTQVTIYHNGQISQQFHKAGFKCALSFAAHELGKAVEQYTLKGIPLKLESTFLSKTEWSCTLEGRCGEVFGVTVEESK